MQKNILIISGEPSGDLHAANLVRDLKSLDNSLSFFGIGGELSRKAGVDIAFDITKLALVGVVEVLKNLGAVKMAHDAVITRIGATPPDAAILVDYPGFNLKIAAELAKRKIPVIYYISPQIWAWGFRRIHVIKKCVRKMVVFFGFEEKLYRENGIDAESVGHPLLDVVKATSPKAEVLKRYGLSEHRVTLAILPGSRDSEIGTFLPTLAHTAGLINERLPGAQFIISKRPDRPAALYEEAFKGSSFDYRVVEGDLHNIVSASDFAIVASGTATLETAILGTPLVIVYKASWVTYLLYRLVRSIPFLGIVNVIAGREIAPEFLQHNMTPKKIANTVVGILSDPARLLAMRQELAAVKASLGTPGASMRAARAILPILNHPSKD